LSVDNGVFSSFGLEYTQDQWLVQSLVVELMDSIVPMSNY